MTRTYIDNWERSMKTNLNGFILPRAKLKWLPMLASLAVTCNFFKPSIKVQISYNFQTLSVDNVFCQLSTPEQHEFKWVTAWRFPFKFLANTSNHHYPSSLSVQSTRPNSPPLSFFLWETTALTPAHLYLITFANTVWMFAFPCYILYLLSSL